MKQVLKKIVFFALRVIGRVSPAAGIKLKYYLLFRKRLNLKNPHTFAEKIQWLKLNDRDERIVLWSDKYLAREQIKKTIGSQYLVPLLGVWESAEQVDLEALPESFVLKPNNSSGRVIICKNKKDLDANAVYMTLRKWEKENLTKTTGEWVYERIPFKIICEAYLEDEIIDYKMYFADGNFICTQVIAGRSSGNKAFAYFDDQWNLLDIRRWKATVTADKTEKPEKYGEMLEIAKKLAQGFTFARVDLYMVKNKVYFGELSFYPNNGFIAYETQQMDDFFSQRICLKQARLAGENDGPQ